MSAVPSDGRREPADVDRSTRRNGTSPAADTIATVMLVAAGVGAAYLLVTRPRLRRLASTALRLWLGASVPMFLAREVGRAWVESGRRA